MTLEDKKFNARLDQQIALWLQRQAKLMQTDHDRELRPVTMEVVLGHRKMGTKTL